VDLDEGDRPRAPRHPDAEITPRGRQVQQLLVGIHGHLREEMAAVVAAVEAGELDAPVLADAATLPERFRWMVAICSRYCQTVNMHHTIEDRRMFVSLGEADPALRPVLDRLGAEHEAIHALLVAVVDGLARLTAERAGLDDVARDVRGLQRALISHLDYEEDELLEPLGRLTIDI
jgi:hemerythrin-like domain-containing protein